MKNLMIIVGLVISAVALSTESPKARDRATRIHFTKNHNPLLFPGAECIGVVSTETIPARKGDKVLWRVVNGNGHNGDDVCLEMNGDPMNKSNVEIHFKTDVMGAAVMKVLKSNAAGNIRGIVSLVMTEAPAGPHQYQVFYKGVAAGPDPEIDVDCDSCGPGGGGPGGGGGN